MGRVSWVVGQVLRLPVTLLRAWGNGFGPGPENLKLLGFYEKPKTSAEADYKKSVKLMDFKDPETERRLKEFFQSTYFTDER